MMLDPSRNGSGFLSLCNGQHQIFIMSRSCEREAGLMGIRVSINARLFLGSRLGGEKSFAPLLREFRIG